MTCHRKAGSRSREKGPGVLVPPPPPQSGRILTKLNMIQILEETIIKADTSAVFTFLTNIDSLYKIWHPKDHVFCKTIFRKLSASGCIFHFLEILNGFPLYLIVKITQIKKDQYIEYKLIFPFSLLKLGYGYFRIEPIASGGSKLIAFVEYGYKSVLFDKITNLFINVDSVRKHIKEEGHNIREYLEQKNIVKNQPIHH